MLRTVTVMPWIGAVLLGASLTACSPPQDESAPDPDPAIEAPQAEDTASAPAAAQDGLSDPAPAPNVTTAPEFETIGFPDGWEMQPYWSSEYPNAFAVTQEGVTVMGHETITYGAYPPIYCGLPNKAVYSPWNAERIEMDDLKFVSMVFPTTITINEDTEVEVFLGKDVEMLALKTGDQLLYKSYLAEGYFMAEKDGVMYEMNEAELPASTEYGQGPEDQEWVYVTCADADTTRAWVLYEDAINANGVVPYEYTGYAEAADLP
ncbi:MAG: hypothetical protein AAFY82_03225 [Pseudomonadota bacterium]